VIHQRPQPAYSVEKLGSRRDPKILKPLQPSARVRLEGTLGRCAHLVTRSSASLDARQGRIDARTLTLRENHIAADLEFFNRIGQKRPSRTTA
jgi:hypothetical protein